MPGYVSRIAGLMVAGAALVFTLNASPAQADEIYTWNTCKPTCTGTPAPTPSNWVPPGTGPQLQYTFDSVPPPVPTKQLDVFAFRTTGDLGEGPLLQDTLRIFTGGLGIGKLTDNTGDHAVDNMGPDELLVFVFPEDDFVPFSFSIGWKGNDADIVTYIGGSESDDLLTILLGDGFDWPSALVNDHGFVMQEFLDVPLHTDMEFTNDASGRYLIVAARNEVDTVTSTITTGSGKKKKTTTTTRDVDGGEDSFKVQSIVAIEPAQSMPEPGTVTLLGAGLAALALRRRRQA